MTLPEPESLQEGAEQLRELIAQGDAKALALFLSTFHPSDLADLVESLDDEERVAVMSVLPAELASETLAEMEEEEDPGEILAALDVVRGAEILHELADDDAADLIQDLEPDERDRLLAALPAEEAGDIRDLLLYPEDTAGGIMTTELVAVPDALTAGEALEEVRRQGREVEDFYTVFVVDDRHRLLGTLPLADLVLAEPGQPVSELVEPSVASVLPHMDQEEVGRILARYNLVAVPVVNEEGVLLGRITFDDVMDVIEAEQTEDILRLAGLLEEEELRGGWLEAVRSRLPWLVVNLATAILAASVVYAFSEVIEAAVVLASVMPVIAGMGGNAGTQALAVTVRRIALSDETVRRRWGVVLKELLVGLVNGAAIGALVALLSLAVGGEVRLGVVVLLAMWGNMVVAGLAGAFIPIALERLGIDPAVASSVFVTTLTDLCGFFLLLGLASAVLL